MIGPHQSIIWRLTSTGHGAAACTAVVSEERSCAFARCFGELEHADEVRRHELGVGDAVHLDLGQRVRRVEPLHAHDRAPQTLHGRGPPERGGVVQRRRAQVDGLGAEAEQALDEADDRAATGTEGFTGDRRLYALGPAGRARAVEHEHALHLVVEGVGGMLLELSLVARPSVEVAVHDKAGLDAPEVWFEVPGHVGDGG